MRTAHRTFTCVTRPPSVFTQSLRSSPSHAMGSLVGSCVPCPLPSPPAPPSHAAACVRAFLARSRGAARYDLKEEPAVASILAELRHDHLDYPCWALAGYSPITSTSY